MCDNFEKKKLIRCPHCKSKNRYILSRGVSQWHNVWLTRFCLVYVMQQRQESIHVIAELPLW